MISCAKCDSEVVGRHALYCPDSAQVMNKTYVFPHWVGSSEHKVSVRCTKCGSLMGLHGGREVHTQAQVSIRKPCSCFITHHSDENYVICGCTDCRNNPKSKISQLRNPKKNNG